MSAVPGGVSVLAGIPVGITRGTGPGMEVGTIRGIIPGMGIIRVGAIPIGITHIGIILTGEAEVALTVRTALQQVSVLTMEEGYPAYARPTVQAVGTAQVLPLSVRARPNGLLPEA